MVDTSSVITMKGKDETQRAFNSVNASMRRTKVESKALTQQFRFMRGGMGQMGHQVQDIAVQLQMGQNAMLIFGQQGSQIASLFGPHGAILGAFLAVGAALYTSLTANVEEGISAFEELEETMDSVMSSMNLLENQTFELSDELREQAKVSQELARSGITLAILESEKATKLFITQLKLLGRESSAYKSDFTDALDGASESSETLIDRLFKSSDSYAALGNSAARASREGLKLVIDALKETPATLEQFTNAVGLYQKAIAKGAGEEEYLAATESISKLARATNDPVFVQFANDLLSGAVGLTEQKVIVDALVASQGDLGAALKNTKEELKEQQEALKAVAKVQKDEDEQILEMAIRIRAADKKRADAAKKKLEDEIKLAAKIEAAFVSKSESAEKSAQKIITSAMNEYDQLDRIAADQKQSLDLERSEGILKATTYAAAITAIDTKLSDDKESLRQRDLDQAKAHADRIKAEENRVLEAKKAQTLAVVASAQSGAAMLSGILEEGSRAQKAAFAVEKALAIATIIINTNAAASKAGVFAAGSGIAAWFASSAGITAAGYAQAGIVAGTSLASFEGGGFTGNGIRAGGMDGKGGKLAMLHPNEKVTDLTLGGESSSVNVTFNIQANDTKGFDQLLASRRGTIVGLINQAMNNRGKAGVV